MYMDDIKLFVKYEKELETIIKTLRIYSQDIWIEFGINKWAMLVMKSGKRHITEGVELRNQVDIKLLGDKENYKYLLVFGADTMKQQKIKE